MTSNLISGNMPVLQVSLKRWKCASIVLHATLGIKKISQYYVRKIIINSKTLIAFIKENNNKF